MSLNFINNYKDICLDIEIQEVIIQDIEKEILLLKKLAIQGPKDITGINYSSQPRGSAIYISLDRILDRIERVEKRLEISKEILFQKIETKNKIDLKIKELNGLDAKVVYMRDIARMSLKEMADKLGYSEIWIKKKVAETRVYFKYTDR